MVDQVYIDELKQRSAQIAALQAKLNPQPATPNFEDQFYSLRQHPAEGPGQVVQPNGTLSAGSYLSAGVTEPEQVAFAQAAHLDPALAAQLFRTVEGRIPNPNDILVGYTAGATSLADAANRRTEHLQRAQEALDALGGAYAQKLKAASDKLPRAALDLLIRTVDVKKRVIEERPR
jgi:hypothetical protein